MTDSSPTRFDLLTEPLISIRTRKGDTKLSLPGVLEALGAERDLSFPALRRHQKHAWHAFLVQLAVMALHRGGETDPLQTADRWAELLLDLSDGNRNAWRLVVDDLSEPAFMQPPVPEMEVTKWARGHTPSAIDALVTAKNHDLKTNVANLARAEHWMFSLVCTQTTESYFMKHNGCIRMKGRTACRPFVSVVCSLRGGDRFRNETTVILSHRDNVFKQGLPYMRNKGVALTWLFPWDGTKQLSLACLDPFFLEVCQRIRLVTNGNVVSAFVGTTKKERVDGLGLTGKTGDPWCPVELEKEAALNVRTGGFDYRLCVDLLFSGKYDLGIASTFESETEALFFVAGSASRDGQKRISEGFHERTIRIPKRVASLLRRETGRNRMASISRKRMEVCRSVRTNILFPALMAALTAGKDESSKDSTSNAEKKRQAKKAHRWTQCLEGRTNHIFFERLFAQLDMDEDDAADAWARELIDLAREQLDDAIRSIPQPSIRRYRVENAAYGTFFGCAKKNFPDLYPESPKGANHAENGD